jgi:hypothetical protein
MVWDRLKWACRTVSSSRPELVWPAGLPAQFAAVVAAQAS